MSLAIECGATNSVAVYVQDEQEEIEFEQVKKYHFGPANFKLLKLNELEKYFQNVYDIVEEKDISALAIAMPGVLNETDRKTLKNIVSKIWTKLNRIWTGNDLESAMVLLPIKDYAIRCVVISGTGSCCYGTDGQRSLKIGGYGHIIGDRGSGYAIAQRALRLALRDYEHNHEKQEAYTNGNGTYPKHTMEQYNIEHSASSTPLLRLIMSHLNLVSIPELVNWSLVANKTEIADIARVVIRSAKCGNKVAQQVIEETTTDLADDIVLLINKLKAGREIKDKLICVGLTGSVFIRNHSSFAEITIRKLKKYNCNVDIILLTDTVLGALKMVVDTNKRKVSKPSLIHHSFSKPVLDDLSYRSVLQEKILPTITGLPDTEQRNVRSKNLSSMPITEAVKLMIDEEAHGNRALREHISSIVTLVEKITEAFRCGGRLIYVGAGTSGRLGVLDASECPPTFKSPSHWVQGIIAGGSKAIETSIEGAEDSIEDGITSIEEKDVCDRDVVIGIAACGKTPFVWGALWEALRRSAYTCLLTFNRKIEPKLKLDMMLTINTGPEVLTGSTRLKAGTATKCLLNMLTTLSMVSYGKCLENLMVDLMPVNQKLRDRAVRITMLIVDNSLLAEEEAKAFLEKNHYDIKKSVAEIRQSLS